MITLSEVMYIICLEHSKYSKKKNLAVISPAGVLKHPFTLPQAKTGSHLQAPPYILCPRHHSCLILALPFHPSIHYFLESAVCQACRDPEANQTPGQVKWVVGDIGTQNPSRE